MSLKLILLTGVEEYKNEIKRVLIKSSVKSFSYNEVTGHEPDVDVATHSNWFVGDRFETNSLLFFAFIEEQHVESLFNNVKEFNDSLESVSHLHLISLHIEKSI